MYSQSNLNSPKSSARPPTKRVRRLARGNGLPAFKPLLEALEDRCLLSFSPAVSYPVGVNPQTVLAADFNNDTFQDLAVVNYSDSTVSVLLGNGNGTFDPALNSATGGGPLSLAVGDFNADGKLDLATANSDNVSVLLGNDDGTFQAPANIDLGSNPTSVAVGDFNGDGTMDLGVTSNVYIPGFYGPGYWGYYGYYPGNWYPGYDEGYANVLLGNGDGSFSAPNSTWLGYGSHTLAVATNLNGDAFDDFVTFNGNYSSVNVLLGDSGGNLQYYSDFYTGDYSYSVAAGDLDADGDTDLVTANFYGNSVGVLLGDGSGSFSAAGNYATGGYPVSVALEDFTGDGKVDVAAANYNSNDLSVLYGNGNAGFSTPVHFAVGSTPWAVATGDFNDDTWLDAVTANNGGSDVSVLINDQSWPPPPPTVTINDVTVTEGSTNAIFTLTLSHAYSQTITVHFAMANGSATAGSDYTNASGDVIFTAGQTTQDVLFTVLNDSLAEPTENFVINLSTSDAAIADGQGVVTILDNDPRISINDVPVTEGNTTPTTATFTVSLPYAYSYAITVHYETADGSGSGSATAGSDYTAASGDVTFLPGQTSKAIPVTVLGDRSAEPTETFVVNLTTSDAAIADGQGIGTILDNEPRISINDVTVTESNTGTVNVTFTVTSSVLYDEAIIVPYTTANGTAMAGSDYTAASAANVTIAALTRTNTFSITVLADQLVETTEDFYINLGTPTNAAISDGQGVGTIRDYATPRISISDMSLKEGNGKGNGKGNDLTLFTFTVTLSAASDQTVRVNYTTVNGTATTGSDYIAKSGTLTFAPGETTKTITIVVFRDTIQESDETFYVDLSSNDALFNNKRGTGTILNDD